MTPRSKEQTDRGSGLGSRWMKEWALRGADGQSAWMCQQVSTGPVGVRASLLTRFFQLLHSLEHRLPSLSSASQFVGFALGPEWGRAPAVTRQVSPGSGGESPKGPSGLQVGLLDCESWSGEMQLSGSRGSDWAGDV